MLASVVSASPCSATPFERQLDVGTLGSLRAMGRRGLLGAGV